MNQSIIYVTNAPFFWLEIGMTIATAMFIGATMYNGELQKLGKGLLAVGFYAFFLIFITTTRVSNTIRVEEVTDWHRAYAGIWTWVFVTLAYIFGICFGVLVVKYAKRKHDTSTIH